MVRLSAFDLLIIRQLIQGALPFRNWRRPFLGNWLYAEEQDFHNQFIGGKGALASEYFPQWIIEGFNGIRRIDDFRISGG